jgi:hypothetical protein
MKGARNERFWNSCQSASVCTLRQPSVSLRLAARSRFRTCWERSASNRGSASARCLMSRVPNRRSGCGAACVTLYRPGNFSKRCRTFRERTCKMRLR